MPKRSATEAFPKKNLSAVAAARARKLCEAPGSTTLSPDAATLAGAGTPDIVKDAVHFTLASTRSSHDEDETGKRETAGESGGSAKRASPQTNTTAARPHGSYNASHVMEQGGIASLHLLPGEWCKITGAYDLVVCRGGISIYGAYISASSSKYRVYAPTTHSLPTITARSSSVVEIHRVDDGLMSLTSLNPAWASVWHTEPGSSFCIVAENTADPRIAGSRAHFVDGDLQQVLNRIRAVGKRASRKCMVVGSKGTGKSSTCRSIANAICSSSPGSQTASSCIWLDLDPGQPEFGPPGQISLVRCLGPLIGPNFTHPNPRGGSFEMLGSHFLGANKPNENLSHYLSCARDLLDVFHERAHRDDDNDEEEERLIVNCPGWTTGSGASLMDTLLATFQPEELLVLGDNDYTPIEYETKGGRRPTISLLDPRVVDKHVSQRPSGDLRAFQNISYYHSWLSTTSKTSLGWDGRPLSSQTPLVLRYATPPPPVGTAGDVPGGSSSSSSSSSNSSSSSTDTTTPTGPLQLHAIMSYHTTPSPDRLGQAMDRLPVALVVVRDPLGMPADGGSTLVPTTPEGLPYLVPSGGAGGASGARGGTTTPPLPPLDPRYSSCIGHGIVHSIDPARREVRLISPLSETEVRTYFYNRRHHHHHRDHHQDRHDQGGGAGGSSTAEGRYQDGEGDVWPKLVLVRGKAAGDAMDWSFLEDLYYYPHHHHHDGREKGGGGGGSPRTSAEVLDPDVQGFDLSDEDEEVGADADGGDSMGVVGAPLPPPYVDNIRRRSKPDVVGGGGQEADRNVAESLSKRVWRPRRMPRYTR